jgi:hypothetical protein
MVATTKAATMNDDTTVDTSIDGWLRVGTRYVQAAIVDDEPALTMWLDTLGLDEERRATVEREIATLRHARRG